MTQPMLVLLEKRPEFGSKNDRYKISLLKIASYRVIVRVETLANEAASRTGSWGEHTPFALSNRTRALNLLEMLLQRLIEEGPEPVWEMMCQKYGDPTKDPNWGIRPRWYKEIN